MDSHKRLKLDLALVRTLLDEVERRADAGDGLTAQLVDELDRLVTTLASTVAPSSGKRLRDVA